MAPRRHAPVPAAAATAGAWNTQFTDKPDFSSNSSRYSKYLILDGDVLVNSVLASCGTSRRSTLRSLLAGGGSSIAVDAAVQLPPAISMDSLASDSSAGDINVASFSTFASDVSLTRVWSPP